MLVETMITNDQDPKVINYQKYKYPLEDPVSLTVNCFFTGDKLTIKSYCYPAYFEENRKLVKENKEKK